MRRKRILVMVAAVLVLSLVPMAAFAENGAPSGNHFSLNIIGVSHGKTADMSNAGGGVIFVWLDGYSQIKLFEAPEGESYEVLDKNGTDSNGASLQLPDPGLDPYNTSDPGDADTVSDYSVFVRPLGKPGGWANITTCADLLDSSFGGLLSGQFLRILNREGYFGGYASVESVGQDITLRPKGKSTFVNVTAQLLTIVFKVEVQLEDGSIITEYIRVPIFDDMLENEYWEYDNHGLKLLQVRFYPVGTDVSDADPYLS